MMPSIASNNIASNAITLPLCVVGLDTTMTEIYCYSDRQYSSFHVHTKTNSANAALLQNCYKRSYDGMSSSRGSCLSVNFW